MSADNQSVKEALNKKGAYGADLDLDHYEEGSKDSVQIDDLQSSKYKDYMEKVGLTMDDLYETTDTVVYEIDEKTEF